MAGEEQSRTNLARAQNQRSALRSLPGGAVAQAAMSGSPTEVGKAVVKEGGKRVAWWFVGMVVSALVPLALPLLGMLLVLFIVMSFIGYIV